MNCAIEKHYKEKVAMDQFYTKSEHGGNILEVCLIFTTEVKRITLHLHM